MGSGQRNKCPYRNGVPPHIRHARKLRKGCCCLGFLLMLTLFMLCYVAHKVKYIAEMITEQPGTLVMMDEDMCIDICNNLCNSDDSDCTTDDCVQSCNTAMELRQPQDLDDSSSSSSSDSSEEDFGGQQSWDRKKFALRHLRHRRFGMRPI